VLGNPQNGTNLYIVTTKTIESNHPSENCNTIFNNMRNIVRFEEKTRWFSYMAWR